MKQQKRRDAGGGERRRSSGTKRPASAAAGDGGAAKRPRPASSTPGKPYKQGSRPGGKPAKQEPKKLLSKKEQREVVRSKKLALKKNYATIHETVLLWEQLRPKQATKEEKAALVASILKKLSGNVVELANHHSASRVIQWCMKEGGPADKAHVTSEVKAAIVELSKSKYGRHVVHKLIALAPKEDVPGLAKLLRGHVAELLRHPHGADVLDDLYSVCPQPCRNRLCAELYGREFSLFGGIDTAGDSISHLSQLLQGVDAAKRQAILQHLYKGLAPVVEKALLHPAMTHRLLRELLAEAPGSIVADVIDSLAAAGGNALKMVHTHDGAAAVCMALAYGSPKDRKRLVKGMKTFVWQTAENEWGHVVLATALSVVDDTSLTSKTILGELKPLLGDLVTDKHAHRVLMQLLAPDCHRYLPQATLELMHPPPKSQLLSAAAAAGGGGGAGAGLDEGDEELGEAGGSGGSESDSELQGAAANGSSQQQQQQAALVERQLGESKKAPDVRRRELLGSGPDSLGAALLGLVAGAAGELLCSQVGSEVVVEAARGAAGGLLWELQREGVCAVHAAIVQQFAADCSRVQRGGGGAGGGGGSSKQQQAVGPRAPAAAGAPSSGEGSEGEEQPRPAVLEPLPTQYFASRALRRLLLAGASEGLDGEGARAFAQALWDGALAGRCARLVGSHGEKVLAGLLHCGLRGVEQAAAAELGPLVGGDAAAWAARFMGPPPGTAASGSKHKAKLKAKKQQKQLLLQQEAAQAKQQQPAKQQQQHQQQQVTKQQQPEKQQAGKQQPAKSQPTQQQPKQQAGAGKQQQQQQRKKQKRKA